MTRNEEGWFNLPRVKNFKFRIPALIGGPDGPGEEGPVLPIRGMNGASIIHFAGGGAVPGERIVGILDPGQGITIYPIHSPQLQEFEDQLNRWIDVTWDIGEGATELFPARIRVVALTSRAASGGSRALSARKAPISTSCRWSPARATIPRWSSTSR